MTHCTILAGWMPQETSVIFLAVLAKRLDSFSLHCRDSLDRSCQLKMAGVHGGSPKWSFFGVCLALGQLS